MCKSNDGSVLVMEGPPAAGMPLGIKVDFASARPSINGGDVIVELNEKSFVLTTEQSRELSAELAHAAIAREQDDS